MLLLIFFLLIVMLFAVVIVNQLLVHKAFYTIERNVLLAEPEWERIDRNTFRLTASIDNSTLPSLLILGDCMALSTGATSYSARLHSLARSELASSYRVHCYGRIGATTKDIASHVDEWAMHAKVVWLFAGPNDIKNLRIFSFYKNLSTLFKTIRQRTHAETIIWSIGDISSVPSTPILLRPLAYIMQVLCEKWAIRAAHENDILLLRIMQNESQDPFIMYPETFYAPDIFHPSDIGYSYIFQQFKQLLTQTNATSSSVS